MSDMPSHLPVDRQASHATASHRLLFSIIASIALMLLIVALARPSANPGQGPRSSAAGSDSLPAQLAGQALTRRITGPAALAEIENLHGKGFALTGGVIAHYGPATAWVAQTRDTEGAQAMIEAMTRRIAGGGSPFTPTGTRREGAQTVYILTGSGQDHFYWQAGSLVIWLAADPARGQDALAQLLAAYRK